MNEFEVSNKGELIAAVRAAAVHTHEEARRNPVTIRLLNTSCRYLFKDGITERRADKLVRDLKRLPSRAFQP